MQVSKYFTIALLILLVPAIALAEEQAASSLPNSQSQIISLTDHGLIPKTLQLRKEDSIVFFLNSTSDSLATLEVDFGTKVTHCASSNMEIKQAGVVKSLKPFGPRDFASMCFHDPGSYPVKVYGLRTSPMGLKSEIVVE